MMGDWERRGEGGEVFVVVVRTGVALRVRKDSVGGGMIGDGGTSSRMKLGTTRVGRARTNGGLNVFGGGVGGEGKAEKTCGVGLEGRTMRDLGGAGIVFRRMTISGSS